MKGLSPIVYWLLLAVMLVSVACGGGDGGGGGGGGDKSTPGDTWTTRRFGPTGRPHGLAWNGTHLVAIGDETLASTDALIWDVVGPFSSRNDVAWDGHSFVAVGDGGIIDVSADGLHWKLVAASLTDSLQAVAGSGATWVAVGQHGTIRSSPDGITWTTRSSPATGTLSGVTWTGSQFIAVGAAGTVVASPDGTNWSSRTSPTSAPLSSVVASPSLIIATISPGSGSTTSILTSPDGVTWTPRADLGAFWRVIFAEDRFVAITSNGLATSPDGVTWTRGNPAPGGFEAIVYAGAGKYVAIGDDGTGLGVNAAFTSTDGLNWSTSAMGIRLMDIARAPTDGRLVAVGASNSSQTSIDGISWEYGASATGMPESDPFFDAVWSPPAGAFIGLVQDAANQYGYRSSDGKTWTKLTYAPCNGTLASSETILVNINGFPTSPCIATSPDGMTWTHQTAPAGQWLVKAYWTGSQFVAVGENGSIATSPDGVAWTARTSGVTVVLSGVAASPTTLIIVGDDATILSSSDGGASWVPQTSDITATQNRVMLNRVVWTGTEFFAVGGGGTVLRSSDGATWTAKPTPYKTNLNDIIWSPTDGRLTLVGDDGLTATSP